MSDVAIYVTHMAEGVTNMQYDQGTLKEGLSNVKKLLRVAAKKNIPVIFNEMIDSKGKHWSTRRDIYHDIPDLEPIIHQATEETFKNQPLDPWELLKNKTKTVVVVGYNKTDCTKWLARAANKLGYNFATTDQVLFSNQYHQSFREKMRAFRFYHKKGKLY